MHKGFLITGCILGALAVALGAFGAHTLKQMLGAEAAATFDTGVKYHFYHTLALIFTAILYGRFRSKNLRYAAYLFIGGIVFFSGSLYLLTLLKATNTVGLSGIGFITPLGGLLFIAGWLVMAWSVYKTSNATLKAM